MGIRSRVKRVLKKALSRSDQDARSQHVSVQREVKSPESSPPPVEPKPRSESVEAAKKAQSEKSVEAPTLKTAPKKIIIILFVKGCLKDSYPFKGLFKGIPI